VAYALVWLWGSVVPFTWARVFFGLRGHRGRGQRLALAAGAALLWPLFWSQFALSRRRRALNWVDELERELHAVG
jgi:hypothetical protein